MSATFFPAFVREDSQEVQLKPQMKDIKDALSMGLKKAWSENGATNTTRVIIDQN